VSSNNYQATFILLPTSFKDKVMADCHSEAEIPLKQLEVDGEPKVQPSGKLAAFHAFPGFFLNKTKLIVLAVLLLILLIIIIVLAAVLGHERAKDRRQITRKKY